MLADAELEGIVQVVCPWRDPELILESDVGIGH